MVALHDPKLVDNGLVTYQPYAQFNNLKQCIELHDFVYNMPV